MKDIYALKYLPNIQVQTLLPLQNIYTLLKSFLKVKALYDMPHIYNAFMNANKAFDIVFLQSKENKPINENLVNEIVEKFKKIMKEAPHLKYLKVGDTTFIDALYQATLTLASFNLKNAIDPYTQDPIDPSNRVITSGCHQFDVESLFNYLKRNSIDFLKNPFDNLPFNSMDQQTILNVVIQFVKRENITEEINSSPALQFHPPQFGAGIFHAEVETPAPPYFNEFIQRFGARTETFFMDDDGGLQRLPYRSIRNVPQVALLNFPPINDQRVSTWNSGETSHPPRNFLTNLASFLLLMILITYSNHSLSNRSRQMVAYSNLRNQLNHLFLINELRSHMHGILVNVISYYRRRPDMDNEDIAIIGNLANLYVAIELGLHALSEREFPHAEEVTDHEPEEVNSPRPGR